MQRVCSAIEANYLRSFKYVFDISSEEYVVNLPAVGEGRHRLFLNLPAEVRQALTSGTPQAMKEALDALPQWERANVLRKCAIGEFFFTLSFPSKQ
ncbi:hypothetical protein DSO57_1001970 [Entomophthora muscae]|uniref:Uncharacterized protein n=1 Tax=Entomophthora muscae TaxID=34485 RepID=A0ACC2RNS3_9FUNG|nr:hypothetical protein DSO57_1001970 [Entomophthora muscae]